MPIDLEAMSVFQKLFYKNLTVFGTEVNEYFQISNKRRHIIPQNTIIKMHPRMARSMVLNEKSNLWKNKSKYISTFVIEPKSTPMSFSLKT